MSRLNALFPALLWGLSITIASLGASVVDTHRANAAEPAQCVPREEAMRQLSQKFNEIPVATGVSQSGNLIEVLTSHDGATWSIMMTLPTGLSCMMASGENWQGETNVAFGPGV